MLRARQVALGIVSVLFGSLFVARPGLAESALRSVADTRFDEAFVAGDGLASYRAVEIEKPVVSYARRSTSTPPHHRPEDWIFTDSDLDRLEGIVRETLAEALSEREITVSDEPGSGALRLAIEIADVRFTAPLREKPEVRRIFVEETGRMTLAATLRSPDDEVVAKIRDKRILGFASERREPFSSVRYWRDFRLAMKHWARELARLFPPTSSS